VIFIKVHLCVCGYAIILSCNPSVGIFTWREPDNYNGATMSYIIYDDTYDFASHNKADS